MGEWVDVVNAMAKSLDLPSHSNLAVDLLHDGGGWIPAEQAVAFARRLLQDAEAPESAMFDAGHQAGFDEGYQAGWAACLRIVRPVRWVEAAVNRIQLIIRLTPKKEGVAWTRS